jgi:pheromone shutdown protein TraB
MQIKLAVIVVATGSVRNVCKNLANGPDEARAASKKVNHKNNGRSNNKPLIINKTCILELICVFMSAVSSTRQ